MSPSAGQTGTMTAYEDLQQIVSESPHSIDEILSKEMLKISVRDRNAIDEETHGVSSLARKETPRFLEESLWRLSEELGAIADESPVEAAAYIESQIFPNTYVNTKDFRLRFLRCELFDAKKAATRLVTFLEMASELFGPQVLERPMEITDFSKEELKVMHLGYLQILPYRDRSARPIIAQVGDYGLESGTVQYRMKLMLYYIYTLSEDVESQRHGMTFVNFMGYSTSWDFKFPSPENHKYAERITKAFPLRMGCIHFCMPDALVFHMVRSAFGIMVRRGGVSGFRLKFHVGKKIELLYALRTYGIPVELIPLTETGTIKLSFLKQWAKTRKIIEKLRAEGNPNASSIIEWPRSTDLVFRGGTPLTCHVGNSMFENTIEARLQEHSSAPKTVKVAITKEIVKKVQQEGRFLQWDRRGWWTEIVDPTEIYTKVAEKIRKLGRRKLGARQQTFSSSSTSDFENQDNRKRQKTSPSYTSDGGCCFL